MTSNLESRMALLLLAEGLWPYEREFCFHPLRRFRFDFAFPAEKVAIEAEGGIWRHGRHVTGSGFTRDCEKYNEAALLGWKVLRFTSAMMDDGTAARQIRQAMGRGE